MKKRLTALILILTMLWGSGFETIARVGSAFAEENELEIIEIRESFVPPAGGTAPAISTESPKQSASAENAAQPAEAQSAEQLASSEHSELPAAQENTEHSVPAESAEQSATEENAEQSAPIEGADQFVPTENTESEPQAENQTTGEEAENTPTENIITTDQPEDASEEKAQLSAGGESQISAGAADEPVDPADAEEEFLAASADPEKGSPVALADAVEEPPTVPEDVNSAGMGHTGAANSTADQIQELNNEADHAAGQATADTDDAADADDGADIIGRPEKIQEEVSVSVAKQEENGTAELQADARLFALPENTEEGNSETIPQSKETNRTLEIQVGDYFITACGNIPEGAEIQAVEIPRGSAEKVSGLNPLFAYDIRLVVDGQVWQPEEYGTSVQISVKDLNGNLHADNINLVHVKKDLMNPDGTLSEAALRDTLKDLSEGNVETETIATGAEDSTVSFDTGSFSGFYASAVAKLQTLFNDAIAAQQALNTLVRIRLETDTVYEGDVEFSADTITKPIEDGFEVEFVADDPGEDKLKSAGTTTIDGNIFIKGMKVRLTGLKIAAGKMVTVEQANSGRTGELEFYGTKNDDAVTVTAKEGTTVSVYTGDGNDTVDTTVYTQSTAAIQSGAGDDSIRVTGVAGTAPAAAADPTSVSVDGGAGKDSVSLLGHIDAAEVVLLGETIQVDGTVNAGSVEIKATAEDEAPNSSDNVASVTIGQNAVINSSGDIIIEAKAERFDAQAHNGTVDLKQTKAIVDVKGKLYAGQHADAGQNIAETQGNVKISAETNVTAGYNSDGTPKANLPQMTSGTGSSLIQLAQDSVVDATAGINMAAKTDIRTVTHANAGSDARSEITGETRILADGMLTAGQDINAVSSGILNVKTTADKGAGQSTVRYVVEAKLGPHAQVTAGGDLNLKALAQRNIETEGATLALTDGSTAVKAIQNSNPTTVGNLTVEAKEESATLTQADGNKAIGVTAALNLAPSVVEAKAGGVDAAGKVIISANSLNVDRSVAKASEKGADTESAAAAFAAAPLSGNTLNILNALIGNDEIFKSIIDPDGTFWTEISNEVKDEDGTADSSAAKAIQSTGTYIKDQILASLLPQTAAAVGMILADHAVTAAVTGQVKAESDISVTAANTGSAETVGDATTITDPAGHPVTGGAAITHSVNKAIAEIHGDLDGKNITISATDKSRLAAQAKANGQDQDKGASSATIISGNTVTASVDKDVRITGTSLTFTAEKQKVDDTVYQNNLTKDDQIKINSTGDFDGKDNELTVNLDSGDIQNQFDGYKKGAGVQNYYAEAISGTAGKKNAESAATILSKNVIEAVLGDNVQVTLSGGGSIDMHATDEAATRIVSISEYAAGNRLASAILINSDSATAKTGEGVKIEAAGAVSQQAIISGETQLFNEAADAVNNGITSVVSRTLNLLINDTRAESIVGKAEENAQETAISADSVRIHSGTAFDLLSLTLNDARQLTGSGATGISANLIRDGSQADTGIGSNVKLTGKQSVQITSDVTNTLTSAAASRAAALTDIPGAMNLIHNASAARINAGANISVSSEQDSVNVGAHSNSRLLNATTSQKDKDGIVSLGGSYNINLLNSTAAVNLQSGALKARKNVSVLASGNQKSQLAGLTAAAGGEGSDFDGSVIRQKEKNNIGIEVEKAITIDAGHNTALDSHYKNETLAATGSVALSAAGFIPLSDLPSAVGKAVITVDRANTVETNLGESTVAAWNNGTDQNALVLRDGLRVIGVHVGAEADETDKLAGAGVARSIIAGMTGADVTVRTRNTVKADATGANLIAMRDSGEKTLEFRDQNGRTVKTQTYSLLERRRLEADALEWLDMGLPLYVRVVPTAQALIRVNSVPEIYNLGDGGTSVSVKASERSTELMLAGGINFGIAAGIGANALVRLAESKVEAAAGDISAYGEVSVSAENIDQLTQLNVNTGAGQVAAEIGVTVNDLNSKVNAGVSGTVNSFSTRDNSPGISITAQNDATVKSTAVALAGAGEFALTPVFAFTGFGGETNATVKTGSDILSGKGITMDANSTKTMNQYTTGASFAGGAALSGAVSVTTVKDSTHALVEQDTNILAGSLNINAKNDYTARDASAALACSGDAAVSVNGIVSLVKAETLAETEGRARLDEAVSIVATSKRDVINEALGFDVSGHYAGAMTVMVLSAGDKMDQDAADQLIRGSSKKESEQALNPTELGERLDQMGIRNSGSAELADDLGGDGKKIDTKKLGSMKSAGYGFDASSGYKASDTSDNDAENVKETADLENARAVGDTDYTDDVTDYVNARIGTKAVIRAGKINVYAEEATMAELFGAAVSAAGKLGGGISFTGAKLRSNVFAESLGTVDAGNGVMSVHAVSRTGEAASHAVSAERERMNEALKGKIASELISADRSIRAIGLAVGLGGVAGFAVSGGVVRLNDNTQATIGGTVQNASEILVQGDTDYQNVAAGTIAVAGSGAMAVSASVAVAAAEGNLKAAVNRNADLSGKNLTVNVLTNSTVKVYAASTTAAASVGGTVIAGLALANNRLKQDTAVERGATIGGTEGNPGDLTVKGFSETVADAFLMGLNVGSVAVGMGVAIAKIKPTLNTTVGVAGGEKDSTTLNHLHSVNILNEVNSNALADVLTASAGAANINANVLLVYNDTKATAKAAAVQGDTEYLTIRGKLDAIGISRASADIVSGVSVGVTVNHTGLNSKNDAILETDSLRLKISRELTVIAGEDLGEDKDMISWNTQAIAHSVAAGISALNASVNTAVARNNSQNNAQITGSNLTAGKVNLYSFSNGRADAMVKGFSISLANVSVSVVMALNETTSRSYMDLSGKLNGSLNAMSDVKGETNASLYTGTGALLGTVATNVATAKGRTASIANVHIGTGTTSGSHSYVVRSTGRDNVETLIENLKAGTDGVLSVGTMVGRAFSRDVYDAELYLTGGKYKLKDISVTTDYTTGVKATTTPSTSGVDVNLAAVAVNKATAKNMSYAMSRLQTQGDPDADRATTVEAEEDVTVKTTGSAEANAAVNPAEFTVSLGLGIGANQARADVTGTQAAILELGYGGIGKAKLVDVQSIVQKADALASVGGNGTKDKSRIKISGISAEVNSATANESLASTATVMGGVTGYDTIQGTVDYGHWEKTWEGIIDYDTPVEPETIYNWGEYLWDGKLKSGYAQMYRFLDPETGEMMYNAFSTKERDDIKKYYDKNGIKYKLDSWTTNIIEEEDGNMYLAYFDWIDTWVSEPKPAEVKVNLYNPAKNILKADSLNIYAGMASGKTSKAEASSNGAKSFSIVTAGNLKAEAHTGESISAMLEGVTATITGDANLKASSNPKAIATGYEPGGWGAAGGTSSHAKSGVGTQDKKETVTVVIGTGATLKAANVNLTAVNSGEAVSSIEGEENVTLLAGISKGSQPTESWYDTLITVGRNAKVEATAGNVNLISVDSPTARSELVSSGFSVGVNYNSMKGENEVHQENNIDIVDGASVVAEKDVRIEAWQSTKATASTDYDGTGIVVASNTVSAVNTIRRVARANLGENTTIRAKNGNAIILAMDGIEDVGRSLLKGKHDDISTYARVSSSGFVGLANAKATTNLTGTAEIIVNAGAAIYGGNNVTMRTLSSSFAGTVKFAEDMMTSETSWEKPVAGVMLGYTAGIRTYAESKGAAAIPLPNAVAKANLDFNTFISINRGNVNGPARIEYNPRTGEYETVYPAGYKKAVSLRAGNGKLFIDASNDRLYVKVGAESEGKGAAGVSNATGQIDVMLTNAVWIDNASLSGKTNILIYADNGSDRPGNDVNTMWKRLGVCFEAATKSKLKSVGKAKSNTRITGTQINQIRSSDRGTVTFWRGDEWISGSKVAHKAPDPTGSVYQNLKADASVPKILGIKLGKTVKKKELNWYYFDRCDWCETGQEYDVSPTQQKTLQQRYKEAYERALVPIFDIQRMVEQIGTMTRAHYNLFEDQTVISIYALDIQHILEKDIRLTKEMIADYKLWTNDRTDHTTYLLPNATQLHIRGGKLEFVTEILRGDALGDGQTRYISLYTAVTSGAYARPIIPIGSTGTLDFRTGILTLPSFADYELYLHEVSSEWLLDQFESGMMRRATADQDSLNTCALETGELPEMAYANALVPDGEKDGWQIFWLGNTPETAADADETLICLLVNSGTDEIDACRTSVNMLAAGKAPVDVSLYIYRDAKADRKEEELYNVFFYDTPEGEMSLLKVITNTIGEEMQIPRSLQIRLRRFRVKDSAETAFCLNDQVMILCREENGKASALDGFYTATFTDDSFESKYILVIGLADGNLVVIVKKSQPVWGEWTGENTAETIDGTCYTLIDGIWYEVNKV